MARKAADIQAFPAKSAIQDVKSFPNIIPISTGGLVSLTGARGVPSGVTVTYRVSADNAVSRVGTGLYLFTFAGAPNGTVRAWVELQSATGPTVVDIQPVARDVATGYAKLQCYSASGSPCDPANGDVLGFQFDAFSTGNAGGP